MFRRTAPSASAPIWIFQAFLAAAIVAPAAAREKDISAEAAAVLARHCLECHNSSDRKGSLDLARRAAALTGGDSGPALVPGKADKSLLVERTLAGEMPPEGRAPMSAAEKQTLRDWIAAGATWSADPIDLFQYTTDRRAGYDWWSLQPIKRPQVPKTQNTKHQTLNPIDSFILAKLEANGLSPSPPADPRTLIRRLYFDLLGLPPEPAEVDSFISEFSPSLPLSVSPSATKDGEKERQREGEKDAYNLLVSKLLDSPHYGERWARHWLDIVRYGESQGFERNKLRPNAWRYRDFVVEAFNADLPYDDFIRWQIAGDVLRPGDPLAVVASGFLVMGPYDLTAYTNGTADMRAFAREEELEGLVGTVCQTFLGLTVNCSRCHDHKFDPVTQREFYQVSAALGGTYHGDERESRSKDAGPALKKRIAALKKEIEQLASAEDAARRSRAEGVLRLLEGGPAHISNPKQPGEWRILARGDFRRPGEAVAPRGIAAVTGVTADWKLAPTAPEAERRKALAEWIASPANPLTPRVIVNRLWGYHFGAGLVRTPSDFGFQGSQPSHPELLDWLASELVENGWSLKHIQRLIVTSATYRQGNGNAEFGMRNAESANPSSTPHSALRTPHSIDADNRFLWRRPPQRLEAETFRDAVLAVSGQLDRRIGGPGFRDFKVSSAGNNETYSVFDAVGPEFNRRSLYRTSVRTGTSPLLDMLDCPDPSVATPRRSVTTTPLQALSLLNNKFTEHYAERFAERLVREAPDDAAAQVRRAYALAFARQPAKEEEKFALQFVADYGLTQWCVVMFNASEFLYVD
jgi:hypothetical protein